MDRVYSWDSFIEIHKDKENDKVWEAFIQVHGEIEGARSCFEYACADLLYHEVGSRAYWIKSAGGDGGIDICVVNDDDTYDIYQCKFFPPRLGELNSNRWRQVKESFATIKKNWDIKVKHWYLCMPRNLSKRELEIFEEFKKENSNTGICIEFIDGSHLISRMQDVGIAEKWFGVISDSPKTGVLAQRPSLNEIKSIRRLADDLWVNWATACLTMDYASALVMPKADKNESTEQSSEDAARVQGLLARLDPVELRLLSVLVQKEGAVVSWEELYSRGFLMLDEIDIYKLMTLRQEDDSMICIWDKEEEMEYVAKAAVEKLCAKSNALKSIIEESDKGFRIRLCGFGSSSAGDDSLSAEGKCAKNDWKCLADGYVKNNEKEYSTAWMRRYYAEVCGSFEERVSNASNKSDAERDTFGKYTMIEVYVNAYVRDANSHGDALLDHVEKWYCESLAANSSQKTGTRGSKIWASKGIPVYGKVMVIHGQPGDGKTTFCKKAVYAHCYEGWLKDAPQVLRLSLNPKDSNNAIVDGKKLNIPGALCLYNCVDNTYYNYDPKELEKGSLIILDGYDELVASLADDEDASTFEKFYGQVCTWAAKAHCNVIITSRTMCIERELNAMTRSNQHMNVVSFAPMSEEQQNLMIERMIELDKERKTEKMERIAPEADENDSWRMDLQDYYEKELPELRKIRVGVENKIKELLEIPVLFRMIVACRFKEVGGVDTKGELYSRLFHSLMSYKNRTRSQEIELLAEYEKIAARIFVFSQEEDTCPYNEETEGRELIYYFLTKNDNSETGRIGFLHRAFYQYFLARRIVSGVQAVQSGGRPAFASLCMDLRARRVSDPFVWELVTDIARMKGSDKDDFDEQQIRKEHIEIILGLLNEETNPMDEMMVDPDWPDGADAERRKLPAAENILFNLVSSLAAIEKGCRDRAKSLVKKDENSTLGNYDGATNRGKLSETGIDYGRYLNICELLRRGDYNKINLEGLNLRGCNLEGAHFSGAALNGTILQGAKLIGANLEGAVLEDARLDGAHLEQAMLKKAVLTGASLKGAHLEGTNLKEAVLSGAQMEHTFLGEADMTEADLGYSVLENAILRKTRLVCARLDHARLRGADLRQADLRRAFMELCSFDGTDTTDGMSLVVRNTGTLDREEKTNLSEANLSGAIMRGAHLQNVHLEGADLSWVDFTGALLKGTYLTGTDLHDACLEGVHLEGAHMEWASLDRAVLRDAHTSDVIRTPLRRGLSVGDTILFGRYWQRNAEDKEALVWRVLAMEEARVLLITDQLIDCCRNDYDFEGITWENCNIRRWMKEDFIHNAFSGAERARIAEVKIANHANDRYGTKGGNETWDRVFALSIDEAEKYFENDADRMAAVTSYAESKGGAAIWNYNPSGGPKGRWWLRSFSQDRNRAFIVGNNGDVFPVDSFLPQSRVTVRPALWLNM